jgi:hypothetical protein
MPKMCNKGNKVFRSMACNMTSSVVRMPRCLRKEHRQGPEEDANPWCTGYPIFAHVRMGWSTHPNHNMIHARHIMILLRATKTKGKKIEECECKCMQCNLLTQRNQIHTNNGQSRHKTTQPKARQHDLYQDIKRTNNIPTRAIK